MLGVFMRRPGHVFSRLYLLEHCRDYGYENRSKVVDVGAEEARTGGGVGLGLALVAAIAEAHGGSAHAANRRPRGADVWLSVPKH